MRLAAWLFAAMPAVAQAQASADGSVGAGLGAAQAAATGALSVNLNYQTSNGLFGAMASTLPGAGGARHSQLGSVLRYGGVGDGWTPRMDVFLSSMSITGTGQSSRAEVRVGPAWRSDALQLSVFGGAAGFGGIRATHGAAVAGVAAQRQFGDVSLSLSDNLTAFGGIGTLNRDTTYLVAGFPFHGTNPYTGWLRTSTSDLVADAGWSVHGMALGVSAGTRAASNVAADRWLNGNIAIPIRARTTLVLEGGKRPAVAAQRMPAWHYATLSVRVHRAETPQSPTIGPVGSPVSEALSLSVVADSTGFAHMQIRAAASRVEVKGDFTNWMPIVLDRVGDRTWRIGRDLAPGLYRVLIRVDGGEWTVPTNCADERSEFGDRVGLVLVGS